MFCPKCGTQIENEQKECGNCHFAIEDLEIQNEQTMQDAPENIPQVTTQLPNAEESTPFTTKRVAFSALAATVLIMSFMAASSISDGGSEIMQIQSVGGQTLEEAYYRDLGTIYSGFAMFARAFGIFAASILVWLGFSEK